MCIQKNRLNLKSYNINMEPVKKYFIYARKSSESEDRQMASIDSQVDELKKLAKDLNLEIIDILQESQSAKGPGRPIFNEMLVRISKGEATGILCWKLNRLARNPIDGGQISWMLQENVIEHIQTYGRDYKSADNVLMMQVEFGMANQFIRDLRTDTKRGLRAKAERGWYPTFATIGYMHNPYKHKGEKEIMQDPERFDLVRKIWDLMLTGAYTPPQTLKIATEEWGLRNRKGQNISKSNIYRILSDPFYYGSFEYPKGSGDWYEGKHEPMVTREEFELAQDMMGGKHNTRPKTYEFAYKGPIMCGECGAQVTAEHKTKKQKNGVVRNYIYYHCTKRKDPNCKQKAIEEKELEKQLAHTISKVDIPEEFFNWAMTRLKEDNDKEVRARKKIILNQQMQYQEVLAKIDNLIDMRADKEITLDEFKNRKAKLVLEQEKMKSLIDSTNERVTEWFNHTEKYLTFSEDAFNKFENGSLRVRKEMLFMLGSNLTLIDKKLFIVLPDILKSLETASAEVMDIHSRFEPQKTVDKQQFYSDLYSKSSILLRRQDSNLRPID